MLNSENDIIINTHRLSSNNDYYNLVFKKTEKITSAVFYILSYTDLSETNKRHFDNLGDKAMQTHDLAGQSLSLYLHEARTGLFPLQQSLVVLESALRLAASARLVAPDIVDAIAEEIDVVVRFIRNHYANDPVSDRIDRTGKVASLKPKTERRARPVIPKNDFSSEAVLVYSDLNSRTARIKTVLDAKPEATIKDLSEIITDVSTKTIQRDLNSLIENGEVKREGERRWSKYSLIK